VREGLGRAGVGFRAEGLDAGGDLAHPVGVLDPVEVEAPGGQPVQVDRE
jgi:hypothetical protein